MTKALSRDLRAFVEMLAYRRPAGSKTERQFIREFLEPLGIERDKAGNVIKRIGTAPVLWSSHTDTVHHEGGMQALAINGDAVRLPKSSKSNCLGADDTSGVWIMREMILAGIPGLYVFHRGEEIGGVGSRHIANETPSLLQGIECAIALDRKGATSVITHQGDRTCSDVFAQSLADALNVSNLAFAADSGGLFTDTANYTDLVGECTNLSVGYSRQHSADEWQDLSFLLRVRDALLALDTGRLVFERKPGETDPLDLDYREWARSYYASQRTMKQIVEDNAADVADLLLEFGYDAESLLNELYARGVEPQDWH